MSINLSVETEDRLRLRAERTGLDVSALAEGLITKALDWEEQDRAEAVAGIQRGLDDVAAGRVHSANEVFAEMRALLRSDA